MRACRKMVLAVYIRRGEDVAESCSVICDGKTQCWLSYLDSLMAKYCRSHGSYGRYSRILQPECCVESQSEVALDAGGRRKIVILESDHLSKQSEGLC